MLWASTSTKDPGYPDLMYVEPLIGPLTINTMPEKTIAAFRHHGKVVERTVEQGVACAGVRSRFRISTASSRLRAGCAGWSSA